MLDSLLQATQDAGVFGELLLGGGIVAALLSVVTVGLTATRRSHLAPFAAAACLLAALALLGVGEVGRLSGRALSNSSLGLWAASLPLLAGFAGVVVARDRLGVGLGGFTLAVFAAVLLHSAGKGSAPGGLQLPRSVSSSKPASEALVAVTPDAWWVNGTKAERARFVSALRASPGRDGSPLGLMVDERVTFSTFAEVLEAAGEADRHLFELVVLSNDGAQRVIRCRDASGSPPSGGTDPMVFVTISAGGLRITAMGNELDPMGLDWESLNAKMGEVKLAIPANLTVHVTAEPQVPFAQVVKALDAVSHRAGQVLNDDLVVGERP